MIETTAAVALASTWLFRKLRPAGRHLNAEVDHVLEVELQKLSDLVDRSLGSDPSLRRLRLEAEQGRPEPSEETLRGVQGAIETAAAATPGLSEELARAVEHVQNAAQAANYGTQVTSGGAVFHGDSHVEAHGGSVAATVMNVQGDFYFGPPLPPGPAQG